MHRLVHRRHQSHNASTGVANPVVIVDINIDNPSTFHAVTVLDPNDWEETKFDKSVVGQMHESVYCIAASPKPKWPITLLTKTTVNSCSKLSIGQQCHGWCKRCWQRQLWLLPNQPLPLADHLVMTTSKRSSLQQSPSHGRFRKVWTIA